MQHIADSAVKTLDFSEGEESGDSVVGEHSPFVRHTAARKRWALSLKD